LPRKLAWSFSKITRPKLRKKPISFEVKASVLVLIFLDFEFSIKMLFGAGFA